MASDKCSCFKGFCCIKHAPSNLLLGRRNFSSRAGATRKGAREEQDDLAGRDSDIETTDNSKAVQDNSSQDESEDEQTSKLGLSEDDYDDGDAEADLIEKAPPKKRVAMVLVDAMIVTNGLSIKEALNKWVEEGKKMGRAEIYPAMLTLRKLRMYGRALQVNCLYSSHTSFLVSWLLS